MFHVTLTDANTNYNLLALARAIKPGFVDVGEFVVQVEDDGGLQVVLIGGSDLDATHYGWKLTAGDSTASATSLLGLYARSSLAAKKLNIWRK